MSELVRVENQRGLMLFRDGHDHFISREEWNALETYKDKFLYELNRMCEAYKLIGMSISESPMWLQFNGVNEDKLVFKSSQRELGFNLVKWEEITDDFRIAYDYFKNLKYNHLKKNHPTIYKELM